MHYENREYWRSVEHRDVLSLFCCVSAIVNHCWQWVHVLTVSNLAEDVLANDYESNTSWTNVLLCTTVDKSVLLNVNWTAHDVGTHIGNKHYVVDFASVEVLADFGTVNGVVGCDVEVICISRNVPSLRNVAVSLVFRRSNDFYITEELSFLSSLLSPNASLQVSSLLVEQVSRNGHKLSASTTTEEQYFVFGRNVEDVSPKLASFFHCTFPTWCTVRNFHKTDTGVIKITDSVDSRFNRFFWQYAWTCVKIICLHFKFFIKLFIINYLKFSLVHFRLVQN